jgi:hypothetical protein
MPSCKLSISLLMSQEQVFGAPQEVRNNVMHCSCGLYLALYKRPCRYAGVIFTQMLSLYEWPTNSVRSDFHTAVVTV